MEKTPQDSESRHADKIIVRLPDGMRARLQQAARTASRTMNAEVVARLTASFDESAETDLHAAVAMIQADLAEIKRRTARKKPAAKKR